MAKGALLYIPCSCESLGSIRSEHGIPSGELYGLRLQEVKHLLRSVLLVHYKTEGIGIEPRIGHDDMTLDTRLLPPAILDLPLHGLTRSIEVNGLEGHGVRRATVEGLDALSLIHVEWIAEERSVIVVIKSSDTLRAIQFTGISDNLYKYGVVPAEIMPETASSSNTKLLGKMLARTLRQTGIQLRKASEKGESLAQLRKRKEDGLKKVYRLLSLNLGVPPTSFTYTLKDKDGKAISTETYTPQSFYERFVGADLRGQFVMLMNDPSRPYYKVYEIEYDRHAYDGKNWTYVNLPMDEIKQMAIASLKDNTMMYYSCDVGRELDRSQGIAALDNYDYASLLGYPFDMDKAERIQTFDSGSTHAMTLKAVDLDASGKPVKWKVENSWGEKTGVKGHIIMTDAWFDAYTFRLVVNKKYATQKVLDLLKTKPVQLPAWDPMFAPDAP